MGIRSKQVSNLKEACLLTGACWCSFIFHEGEVWKPTYSHNLLKQNRKSLINFLIGDNFLKWFGVESLKKHSKMLFKMDHQELGCLFLYLFRISELEILVVGVNEEFDSKCRKIWQLAANIIESNPIIKPVEEIDLLQNEIIELKLNQQELQARINAQREAEAGLIQTAKLAAVGEMAAGVAHELNNPLTSIVGFTELVLEELPEESVLRKDLALVLQEALRARSVVRGLLDFARQTETIRIKVDINEIINDVLMLTKHFMSTNNVILETHLGENLNWIFVDCNQIKQVVINLINNALHAMPAGGKIVIETAERFGYGSPWLTLTVKDTGVGIPQENLERIFEPFFTTRGDQGGTGLGLSVTFGIVTDHGGMIEVESELQVGSSFMVWLPMDQPE